MERSSSRGYAVPSLLLRRSLQLTIIPRRYHRYAVPVDAATAATRGRRRWRSLFLCSLMSFLFFKAHQRGEEWNATGDAFERAPIGRRGARAFRRLVEHGGGAYFYPRRKPPHSVTTDTGSVALLDPHLREQPLRLVRRAIISISLFLYSSTLLSFDRMVNRFSVTRFRLKKRKFNIRLINPKARFDRLSLIYSDKRCLFKLLFFPRSSYKRRVCVCGRARRLVRGQSAENIGGNQQTPETERDNVTVHRVVILSGAITPRV